MSIFVEIVRHFLVQTIMTTQADSLNADNMPTNAFFTSIGLGRDLGVSEKKRTQLDLLLPLIQQFTPTKNDKGSLVQLSTLLLDCKNSLLKMGAQQGFKKGLSEHALAESIELIRAIYDQFQKSNLLDIPNQTDPLTIFQYQAAFFFAEKIKLASHSGMLQQIVTQRRVTNLPSLADAQEQLIISMIARCKELLAALDKSHRDYDKSVYLIVKSHIEELIRANDALAESIHSALGIFERCHLISSGSALLLQCMNKALTLIIEDIDMPQSPTPA